MNRLIDRFIVWVRDHPKTVKIPIGPADDPTYWRYFVIPRNPIFNIYLHHFRHSDVEDLHDHRMANISILLQGTYWEERFMERPVRGRPLPKTHRVAVGRFIVRRASTPHRVVLLRTPEGKDIAMWSLFIGGPHLRDWGFWLSRKPPGRVGGVDWSNWQLHQERYGARWISHSEIVTVSDPTAIGYGQRR